MRSFSFSPRSFPAIVFVLLAVAGMCAAQTRSDNPDPAESFYLMTRAAPAAFTDGETAKAGALAEQLLKDAESWKQNWNYGNATHAANIVLGRIALKTGETDEAKKFLLAAGKTPGSAQLNTFGPDMTLAKDLLEKGERDVVIEYLALCSKFWGKHHQAKIDNCTSEVKAGVIPHFGANLKYLGF